MSKFVGKYRQNDYFLEDDDFEYSKTYVKNKKRKSESAELKKLRMQQYEDDNYGYESYNHKKNKKYAKL